MLPLESKNPPSIDYLFLPHLQSTYGSNGKDVILHLDEKFRQHQLRISEQVEKNIYKISGYQEHDLNSLFIDIIESVGEDLFHSYHSWAPIFFKKEGGLYFRFTPFREEDFGYKKKDLYQIFIRNLPDLQQREKKPIFSDEQRFRLQEEITKLFASPLTFPPLTLPSGKTILAKEFIDHPLFRACKEKEAIFKKLYYILENKENLKDYKLLLNTRNDRNFHEKIKKHPSSYNYLYFSIIAFLDEKIDQEELFIIHMIGALFQYDETSPLNKVTAVKTRVIEQDEAADYFQEANFPLFSKQLETHISNCRSKEEIEKERKTFLEEFSKREPLKRTSLEYTLKHFGISLSTIFYTIEMGIFYYSNFSIGYKNINREQATVVLLSPQLSVDMLYRTSAVVFKKNLTHLFIFGYDPDDTPFYQGIRVISIPSPLFFVPYIHGYNHGPRELGLYHHDVSYHLPLEVNNPHINQIVCIAKKLKSIGSDPKINDHSFSYRYEKLANKIIDREANVYRWRPPQQAFVSWFTNLISPKYYCLNNEEKIWIKENVLPLIRKELDEIGENVDSAIQKTLSLTS